MRLLPLGRGAHRPRHRGRGQGRRRGRVGLAARGRAARRLPRRGLRADGARAVAARGRRLLGRVVRGLRRRPLGLAGRGPGALLPHLPDSSPFAQRASLVRLAPVRSTGLGHPRAVAARRRREGHGADARGRGRDSVPAHAGRDLPLRGPLGRGRRLRHARLRRAAAARLHGPRGDAGRPGARARAAHGGARGARRDGHAVELPELRRASGAARAGQDGARRVPELRLAARREPGAAPVFEDARTQRLGPVHPAGRQGRVRGAGVHLIGYMVRSVEFEGVRYFWQEYLLYEPAVGFRWLVESDGHWSYVTPVPPGEVSESGPRATHGGRSFKMFQDAVARVEYVEGEFYWRVE